jgi:hypothetical protein
MYLPDPASQSLGGGVRRECRCRRTGRWDRRCAVQSSPSLLTVQADLEDLPLLDEAFDFLLSIGVPHHLRDTEHAFGGSASPRALGRGGVGLMSGQGSGQLRPEWRRNFLDYIRPYGPEDVAGRMVLDAGVRAGSVAVLRALAIAVRSAVLSANLLSGRDDRALVAPIGVATVDWTASSLLPRVDGGEALRRHFRSGWSILVRRSLGRDCGQPVRKTGTVIRRASFSCSHHRRRRLRREPPR